MASSEEKKLEAAVRFALQRMLQPEDGEVLAEELLAMCKNPEHRPCRTSLQRLEKLGLLQNGSLHEEIKRCVLKLLKDDGLNLVLTDPE